MLSTTAAPPQHCCRAIVAAWTAARSTSLGSSVIRHTAAAGTHTSSHARHGCLCSSTTTSTWSSEQVTRTVLGCSSAMMHLGVAPAGLRAFCAAAFSSGSSSSSSSSSSSGGDSTSLATSLRVQLGPVSAFTAELLSDSLLGLGAQSVVVEEAREEGQREQARYGADAELWDSCRLLVHFGVEHDVEATMATAQEICEVPELPYTVQAVVDQEWVAQIQASYVPVQVTDGLFIIPEWDTSPLDASAINVRLVPGVAFGTGEHPTTKLCLQRLMGLDVKGAAVMDYGTGSGVLAITALLLGAASAVCTDTDPLAVRAAAANAALNGVQDAMRVLQCGASLEDADPVLQLQPAAGAAGSFDLVMANILRGPLLELQPRLTAYVSPGGRLILSGILVEQAPDVRAAYQPFFEDFEVASEGSWALVTAVRRQS